MSRDLANLAQVSHLLPTTGLSLVSQTGVIPARNIIRACLWRLYGQLYLRNIIFRHFITHFCITTVIFFRAMLFKLIIRNICYRFSAAHRDARLQNKEKCKFHQKCPSTLTEKLDGVGPVDNIPSTNKLHQFVQKKEKINYM